MLFKALDTRCCNFSHSRHIGGPTTLGSDPRIGTSGPVVGPCRARRDRSSSLDYTIRKSLGLACRCAGRRGPLAERPWTVVLSGTFVVRYHHGHEQRSRRTAVRREFQQITGACLWRAGRMRDELQQDAPVSAGAYPPGWVPSGPPPPKPRGKGKWIGAAVVVVVVADGAVARSAAGNLAPRRPRAHRFAAADGPSGAQDVRSPADRVRSAGDKGPVAMIISETPAVSWTTSRPRHRRAEEGVGSTRSIGAVSAVGAEHPT